MPTDVASLDADAASTPRRAAGHPKIQSLRVARKDLIADGVVLLRLEEPHHGRVPDWAPGAHVELVLPTAQGGNLSRHYSLCGDRWDPTAYEVAVLREPRSKGGSHYVHDTLQVGDLLTVGTPRNNFSLAQATRYEFVAGGIGITPIMTMIVAAEQQGIDWHLTYGGRTRASMAFLDVLAQYGDRVTVWPQDERGHIDLSFLHEPQDKAKVYCCGPEPLLNAVMQAAGRWPSWAVRFERFVPAVQPPPVRSEPFTLDLAYSGKSLTVGVDETVLSVLNDAGVPILSSCNEGICGTCEVSVLAGTPEHRDSLLNDNERALGDRMFVCVSRSITDRLVLDL